ncbi:hypothetical protein CSW00_24845 [Pseudomonas asiatica]|nr:hypothetical protein CSW00_24845 [Pseudomonas sp. MR 02]TXI04750.1 MAG: hypothetical protein E6Q70_12460 [Pseudomonas monteilii]
MIELEGLFAGEPAPTGSAPTRSQRSTCGSGRAREAGNAVDGTGFAGVRGHARSHKYRVISSATPSLCAGLPANGPVPGVWRAPGLC